MVPKILLTGSSGFLGKEILKELTCYKVDTLSRTSATIEVDLVRPFDLPGHYDIVIHAAGKAHSVPQNNSEAESFFTVNVEGTRNLLSALSKAPPAVLIFISSVAVYGKDTGLNITEDTPLLAKDPYGRSKIEAEAIIMNWCQVHGVLCGILRLPLLAGPNPPGNLGAMIYGIKKGYYFDIGGGQAYKSMVLVGDVAKIIPEICKVGGIYNLTDGYNPSFHEISTLIANQLKKRLPRNIPMWMAKCFAKAGDILGSKAPINTQKLKKISSNLTFDDSKARLELGWNPTPVLKGFKIS